MKKINNKILVISFSELHRDPRVRRQLTLLSSHGYNLYAAGYSDPEIPGVKYWHLSTKPKNLVKKLLSALKLKIGLYQSYYNSLSPVRSLLEKWSMNGSDDFDLVIANDIESLPVAFSISGIQPVFIDAHEYSPEEMGGRLWRFFFAKYKDWMCRRYLPKVSAMSTVCNGISERYEKVYSVSSFVTYSAPIYQSLTPNKVDAACIRIVHHGGIHRERGIEAMIDMMGYLDSRYELHLYLLPDSHSQSSYLNELKSRADNYGTKIIFHDTVPTEEISRTINQYDIGLFLLKPSNYNYLMALPNKFFEFVQARLAIAIGPSPEMVKLLNEYKLGVVSNDFSPESMADVIRNLSPEEILAFKTNSDNAAKELSFDFQSEKFISIVNDLTAL